MAAVPRGPRGDYNKVLDMLFEHVRAKPRVPALPCKCVELARHSHTAGA